MSRVKIDYGIDLGTTNSAIARMEGDEPVIRKTDVLKDTMPSCVAFNKKGTVRVGDSAYNALKSDKVRATKSWSNNESNSFIEFKRTMGTDKVYHSSNMARDFSSEELSAEVLKTLKSFVTEEDVRTVVITVPAMFTINQRDATSRAAELAGFEHCELLQEPIAASMAYGLDTQSKDGYWLVFDFGGGTFDAALLKVEEGIMKVVDTEGDNWLGGRNIDHAIVDEIIIPYLRESYQIENILKDDVKREVLREAMKTYAEEVKIQLSFKDSEDIISNLGELGEDDEGEEIELDLTVTSAQLEAAIAPLYQKAIDIALALLERNGLTGTSLESLILVGGPTHSPILRRMLAEQITRPDTSCDPMTVVAKGAALYASTIDIPDAIVEKSRDKTKVQLSLGYEATTVEVVEFVTVKILEDKTEEEIPEKVYVEIIRSDKAWSSGKVAVDGLGEIVEVQLNENRANSFEVKIYDEVGNSYDCEPNRLSVIQGAKVGNATLPRNIGIEILDRSDGRLKFLNVKGLEKNASTPATGVIGGLKTQKQMRPGVKEDVIKIPVYEGDYDAPGSRSINNEHVYDITITGEYIPSVLPEGSDVDLTLTVDREKWAGSVFFPYLEYTHPVSIPRDTTQKEVDSVWLEEQLQRARQTLIILKQEGAAYVDAGQLNNLEEELTELIKRFEQGKGDYDRKKEVLENLKKIFKELDRIEEAGEWPKTEEELKDVFYRLEETNKEFGNEKTTALVEQFRGQIPQVVRERDVRVAQELIEAMRHLDFRLIDEGLGAQMEIGLLQQFNAEFDSHSWRDRNKARMLINQGLQMAANNPSKERLRPLISELFRLLPEMDRPIRPGGDQSVLTN